MAARRRLSIGALPIGLRAARVSRPDAPEAADEIGRQQEDAVRARRLRGLRKVDRHRRPLPGGRDHRHLAEGKEEEKIRFRDVAAQPRKIISSPIWSGLESEHVCYNAGYTNVHELIPWRTLTGRQQLYQDHHWMRAFGEGFVTWRPPIDTKTVMQVLGKLHNGNQEIMLNILTPHQKWGIH